MMKKLLRYIILLIVIGLASFLLIRITASIRQKDAAAARIQMLPSIELYSLKGDKTNIRKLVKDRATVIIYFSPDCEYCQYEATELHQNFSAFQHTEIIMVTHADPAETMRFVHTYRLDSIPFIHFLLDKNNLFSKTFGTRVFPSIFIYNKDHKLIKKFIGETKIEAIMSAMED